MVKMRRYQKIIKNSNGYKQGLRYIDYGATWRSKTKFLRRKPKDYATAQTICRSTPKKKGGK